MTVAPGPGTIPQEVVERGERDRHGECQVQPQRSTADASEQVLASKPQGELIHEDAARTDGEEFREARQLARELGKREPRVQRGSYHEGAVSASSWCAALSASATEICFRQRLSPSHGVRR